MSVLLQRLAPTAPEYLDSRFDGSQQEFNRCLQMSTTVYVGNLSFYTTEEQLYELFSRAGNVSEVVMGLDKFKMTPCGFCFIVFVDREGAQASVRYLNGAKLDSRPIRVDIDWGGRLETRKYGRGRSGGQVRDEHRETYDADRGGWGKIVEKNLMDISAHRAVREHDGMGKREGWTSNKRMRPDPDASDFPPPKKSHKESVLHK